MQSTVYRALPGGAAQRSVPAGIRAGAPLSQVDGPARALSLVSSEMAQAEERLRSLVASEVAAVPAVASYLLSAGGKRLRPALTAIAGRAVGFQGDIAALMGVGELIHLGSLLHDDVVDLAEVRRGRSATHRVFGNAVTILTGDYCLARAVLLASESGGHRVVTELARAVTAMAEGEVLQLQRSGDLSATREEYLEMVDKKSAMLIAWCASAAAYAVEDLRAAGALHRFGRTVGVAFQVTDDVLDYRSGTGKLPGADLRERKITLPLLFAMEHDPSLRGELLDHEPTTSEVPLLLERVRRSGGLEQALGWASSEVEQAIEALTVLPPGPYADALVALGRYLVRRAQ